MTDAKIEAYKSNLTSRYTGMTQELLDKIEGKKIEKKVNLDLNRDGTVDKKDMSLAGKVLAQNKKQKGEN